MPLHVLQTASCTKACANCPNTLRSLRHCDGHSECPGYGASPNCPPLIVLAVVEYARAALAAANLPAFGFGCMRSVQA